MLEMATLVTITGTESIKKPYTMNIVHPTILNHLSLRMSFIKNESKTTPDAR
jgi:hypothetical protein